MHELTIRDDPSGIFSKEEAGLFVVIILPICPFMKGALSSLVQYLLVSQTAICAQGLCISPPPAPLRLLLLLLLLLCEASSVVEET